MKFLQSTLIFLLLSFSFSFSQDHLEITHGPYQVDPAEDGMTIVWFTNKNCVSWVEFSELTGSRTFPTWEGYPKIAKSSRAGLIDANTKKHVIRIKNLDPGKSYKFRVNSKEIIQYHPYEIVYGETVVGDFHDFSTLDPSAEGFTFGMVADVHEKEQVIYDLNDVKPLKEFDMIFLNGDILSWIGDEERIFNGFLDAAVETFASEKPFIYIRGNHETRGAGAREVMSYFPHHSGLDYYSFDHGGVHFIVMDCGEDKPDDHPVYGGLADFDAYRSEQAEWLRKDVQTKEFREANFRVIVMHMPMVKEGEWHGPTDIDRKWGPILNNANIDIVLNGHKHDFVRTDKNEGDYKFNNLIIDKNQLLEVKVSPDKLELTITGSDGELVDVYSIEKREPTKSADWRLGTSVGNIAKFNAETARELSQQGFTDIEVGLGRIKSEDDLKELKTRVKRVKQLTEEAGINVWSMHIPYGRDIDISQIDNVARKIAIDEISTMIKAVRPLKPEKLVLHPSFEPIMDDERAARLEVCIASLPELRDLASKYGMSLTIECLPRTCLGNTSHEILEILHAVPGIGVCADVNHLLQESPDEFINAVGQAIETLHISDYDGIDERHWLPGEGIIDWGKLIESLETTGYDGPWMFESKGSLEEKAKWWGTSKK